jgi:ABC-type glutathione transport system ATPase component
MLYHASMALLEVASISKSYADRGGVWKKAEEHLVVDQVSFSIKRGEALGLVGESGSGKSTVARMVLGLIPPTAGTVHFDGHPVTGASAHAMRTLRRRMQPVFQDPYAALNPRMRVLDIITEPLHIHGGGHGSENSPASLHARAGELLRQVGLDDSALARYPHEFSGGQRQRINIARALALRPELLILDEPVSALDVRYLAGRIAVMKGGRIVEIGEAEQLCRAPQNAYTQRLLAATPELPVIVA